MRRHGAAQPRRDPDRGRAFHSGDEPHGGTVEHPDMDRLAQPFAECAHYRRGGAPDVHPAEDGERHAGQRRARTVGLRHRVLPDESTVGQHRQQPVRGRRRHTQITGGFTQPDFGLLAEEQQQFQCLVDRLDRILGRNGVSATLPLFLHARNATCASVRAS
ncbi:hypothetical protein I552_5418 [Mycobacterium xenopi 3993]|nr:hypothetical protein I552_5418 [Mycobacterium xenopi 3993]